MKKMKTKTILFNGVEIEQRPGETPVAARDRILQEMRAAIPVPEKMPAHVLVDLERKPHACKVIGLLDDPATTGVLDGLT